MTKIIWLICLAAVSTTGVLNDSIGAPSSNQPVSNPESTGDEKQVEDTRPLTLTNVERLSSSFNPSQSQSVGIRFVLSRPADVTVMIWGPNGESVFELLTSAPMKEGLNQIEWDGRDYSGAIVPDEAYFFSVDAVAGDQKTSVNPITRSGGERVTAQELTATGGRRLTYSLRKSCRVLARAAVENGPLLRTMVNWQPRAAGLCLEQWDGLDVDGLRKMTDVKGLKFAVMTYALPEQSIITVGNENISYREYYLTKGRHRPSVGIPRSDWGSGRVPSPYWKVPVHLNKDPRLSLTFPTMKAGDKDGANDDKDGVQAKEGEASSGSRSVAVDRDGGPLIFRVDIPNETERTFINDQRFEVIIYVDDERVLEVEQGHLPFTYPWDVSGLKKGKHLLTVNIASFRNHVGTVSRYVEIR